MTSGGWRRARRASVAASPSMAGMRMSIRDHVGGVPVDQGQHLGAVAGLGHHPDVGAPPSIITRPARTRGSSSTTSTPMVRGSDGVMPARVATRPAASRPRRWGRAPAARRPGRPARPARRGPARARDPRQPRPRARGRRGPAGGHRTEAAPARCRRPRRRGLVADLDGEALAGGAGQVDVHGRSRGVLAGVGQGLLHDPVGGAADQVGDGPADLLAQAHPHPGPARLGHQLPDVGEGGLRQLADRGAQDADDLAQVLEGLVGVLADHLGGAGDLGRVGVGAELQRAGVHAQQRQPVAEDVVHLPGDLVAGPLLGLLGPQVGLGLGAGRPVAQRLHEPAPVVDEQAPADRGPLDGHAEQEQQQAGHPGLGAEQDVDERGQHAQAVHGQAGSRRPIHRHREQRHHHRPGHQLRERRQGDQGQGEPDRPAAPPPQAGAADGGGDLVGGEQPGRLGPGSPPRAGRRRPRGRTPPPAGTGACPRPSRAGGAGARTRSPRRSSSEPTGPRRRSGGRGRRTIPKSGAPRLRSLGARRGGDAGRDGESPWPIRRLRAGR
jgi:hypothetical protein